MSVQNKKEKASAKEVFDRITKGSEQVEIDKAVEAALRAQYENARTYQQANGVVFNLTWDHFFNNLATSFRKEKMGKKMRTGNFEKFMKSSMGYVITWKSGAARKTGVMDDTTAAYLNREASEKANQFGPGDQHTEESIKQIRIARTGTKQTDTTKSKISASMIGHEVTDEARAAMSAASKGKPKSEEHRAKMKAAAAARWAKARAEKEKNNGAQ